MSYRTLSCIVYVVFQTSNCPAIVESSWSSSSGFWQSVGVNGRILRQSIPIKRENICQGRELGGGEENVEVVFAEEHGRSCGWRLGIFLLLSCLNFITYYSFLSYSRSQKLKLPLKRLSKLGKPNSGTPARKKPPPPFRQRRIPLVYAPCEQIVHYKMGMSIKLSPIWRKYYKKRYECCHAIWF